jgi:hypothetical protein
MAENSRRPEGKRDRPPDDTKTTLQEPFTTSTLELSVSKPGTYLVKYDPAVDPPSVAVVATVASIVEEDPLDLEPLSSVIDPDALDTMVRTSSAGKRSGISLTFPYSGFEVSVRDDGQVQITQ